MHHMLAKVTTPSKTQQHLATRLVVPNLEVGAMHTGDCSNKTQAKTVPRRHMRLRTRTPVKRPQHRFALAHINTRSGVGNLQRGKTIIVPDLERELPSLRRELQRIVEQVLDCPEQQVDVADDLDRYRRMHLHRQAAILGKRLIKFNHVAQHDIKRDRTKTRAPSVGVDFRNFRRAVKRLSTTSDCSIAVSIASA
jgi:hypothetical protein